MLLTPEKKYPGGRSTNTYCCYHHIVGITCNKSTFYLISSLLLSLNVMIPSCCHMDPSVRSHARVQVPQGPVVGIEYFGLVCCLFGVLFLFEKVQVLKARVCCLVKTVILERRPTAMKSSSSVPGSEMLGLLSLLCYVKPPLEVMNHRATDFTAQPFPGFSCC